ncbi:MAG TPA: FAD:protein FMN transferase [Gammaproteobacteria bacterium]|nr:FAD:protein FMN transferase [Gammaproteobacteria bacterium]
MIRVLPLVLLSVLLLTACSPRPPVYQEQLLTFGTMVDVTLWNVDETRGQQAVATLARDFDYMHDAWHAWHRGPLGRVNQLLPTGEWFSCPPSIVPLIQRSSELSQASGGLFNPAIGQLIKLWGFASDDPPKGPPPAPEAIRALVAQNPQMSDLQLEGIQLRSRNPAVRLDFGAFAKGYAVDRAIEQLRELGIENAIVNAGGDLRAIGRHGERPWRVGIRHPRQPGMLAAVDIEGDESVFTSGDYERYFDYDGKRYQHIIDPRSGYPAEGLSSVTVFARQADVADAAATAITVAGPDVADWLPVARALGVTGVMLVDTGGHVQMTPSLRERIYFDVEPKPEVRFSEPL